MKLIDHLALGPRPALEQSRPTIPNFEHDQCTCGDSNRCSHWGVELGQGKETVPGAL